MANGENAIATAFAMHLCKIYLIDDRSNAHIIESDLFGTIEVLQRIRLVDFKIFFLPFSLCYFVACFWFLSTFITLHFSSTLLLR